MLPSCAISNKTYIVIYGKIMFAGLLPEFDPYIERN